MHAAGSRHPKVTAQAENYARYAALRDAGASPRTLDFVAELGLSDRTLLLYERAYRRARGLPDRMSSPRPGEWGRLI
jgi:hypothetical protein